MAFARPGREQEEELGAARAGDGAALVGLEVGEGPSRRLHIIAAGANAHRSLDHEKPGVLLHLVVSQLLAGIERDEDGPGLVLAQENDGRTATARSLDLGQSPGVHRAESVTALRR